ncbi:FG-GAP-like repeat-containing protein [Reinekea blandensis]|uniref:Serine protease n=1 Tax=Reinekea blandensis MED297 TaxID=314283 RepID=A4B9L3_9GAMM|nr:FG-GAP-like repeat-containing protein [Reinekea blandensis]EAR11314.1 serine protease [Reinekea sp. MED297] [Reinekea blandensis MED297]
MMMTKPLLVTSMLASAMISAQLSAASIEVTGQGSTFVINLNQGFDDPAHGADRQSVFTAAAQFWADIVVSPVKIEVDAAFGSLFCTSSSATLGSAGPLSSWYYSTGAEAYGLENNTFYPVALFNARTGADNDPGADITASFNGDLDDNANCLNGINWYYGLDHNPPGSDIDFYEVVLHELGHGLGVVSLVDAFGSEPGGLDDAFSRWLKDKSTGELWSGMTNAERLFSMTDTGDLVWSGPEVTALASELTNGVNGGEVQMYAPNPYEGGSSVSHFDTALTPNELMEPQHTGDASYDHTVALLQDIGWSIVENVIPEITGQQTLTMAEDSSLLLTVNDFTVTDSDNIFPDEFTLTVLSGNNYSVSGNRVIPDADFNGELSVDVQVNDGLADSTAFTASVSVSAVNDAPVLTGVTPVSNVTLPGSYEFTFTASDVENDSLSFSLTSDHSWLSITSNGVLSGTPGAADLGTEDVTVTVSDGALTDSLIYPLTVQDAQSANLSVSISSMRPLLALNELTTLTLTVTNEGPAVQASGTITLVLPVGLAMSTWSSGCSQVTSQTLTCSVTDLTGSETFSVTVFSAQSVTGDVQVTVAGDQTDPTPVDDTEQLTLIVSDAISNPTADLSFTFENDVLGASTEPALRANGIAFVELVTTGDHLQKRLDTASKTESTVRTLPNSDTSFSAANVDLDADGLRDLLFAQQDGVDVYRDGGTSAQRFSGPDLQDMLVADLNQDDYPDIVLARDGANEVYLNDQSGGFVLQQSIGTSDSRALALMDANGDGWPDLVVANYEQVDELFLNLGNGSVSDVFANVATDIGSATSRSRTLSIADLDGDGLATDILVGRDGTAQNPSIEWFQMENDQVVSQQSLPAGDVISLATADRDGDGREEVLFLNRQGVVQLWHLENSALALLDIFEQSGATSVLFAPLDADSHADLLITAKAGHPSVVYLSPAAEVTLVEETLEPVIPEPEPESPSRSSGVNSGTFGSFSLALCGLLLVAFRRR